MFRATERVSQVFSRGFVEVRLSSLLFAAVAGFFAATPTAIASPRGNESLANLSDQLLTADEILYLLRTNNRSAWSKQTADTFQRLFPGYSSSTAFECSAADTPENAVAESLLFHRTDGSPEIIQLRFLEDPLPNAFALPPVTEEGTPAEIILTSGLMERLQSDTQLAFVLAHEMAHIRMGHFAPQLPPMLFTKEQLEHIATVHAGWELQADQAALHELLASGFDVADVSALLAQLAGFEAHAHEALPASHPPMEQRIAAIAGSNPSSFE
jgi:Zn-dependent protease with chaperone function